MQNIIYINIEDKQQVLLYSIGNYIWHLVMNHNGKEYEKEYIYVCVCVYTYMSESLCCTSETNTTLKINYVCAKSLQLCLTL